MIALKTFEPESKKWTFFGARLSKRLPVRTKARQVGHSFETLARAVGSPALANRSRRWHIARLPTSVPRPIWAPFGAIDWRHFHANQRLESLDTPYLRRSTKYCGVALNCEM